MQLFLDSAKEVEISYALDVFDIDGVTMNPRHVQAAGKPFMTVIRNIAKLVEGTNKTVSVEVNPHFVTYPPTGNRSLHTTSRLSCIARILPPSHLTARCGINSMPLVSTWKKMGRKFFMCDAVLDTNARQLGIFSGYGKDILPLSWEIANRRTYVPWAKEKFDIMMFGMPQNFHYGNGHGANPLLILQAIGANIIRHPAGS